MKSTSPVRCFVLTVALMAALGFATSAQGAVVAFDNLNDGFNSGAYTQLMDFFEYMEAACSFTTSMQGQLAGIDVAMNNNGFGGHAQLAVYRNNGGAPGALMESADLVPTGTAPAIYSVPFSNTEVLDPGSTYWLVITPIGYPSGFNWYLPNTFDAGSKRLYRTQPTGSWNGPLDEENGFRVMVVPTNGGGGGGGGGAAGSSQNNPILPDTADNGRFNFQQAPSGQWFDPPLTEGFVYTMDSPDSLFTAINGFPVLDGEADGLFTVAAEGQSLGQFGPGDTVDFASLLGHGVTTFTITGIDPAVDAAQPDSFPLAITFSTPTADFSMQAVPEPASLLLMFASGLVILCRRA